jgi:hypothetical protein
MSRFFIPGTEVIIKRIPSNVPELYLKQIGTVLKGSFKRVDVLFQDN